MRTAVADDDPPILRIVDEGPWAARFEPLVAAHAMQVIVFAQRCRPSETLPDIRMPAEAAEDEAAENAIVESRLHRAAPVTVGYALLLAAGGARCGF